MLPNTLLTLFVLLLNLVEASTTGSTYLRHRKRVCKPKVQSFLANPNGKSGVTPGQIGASNVNGSTSELVEPSTGGNTGGTGNTGNTGSGTTPSSSTGDSTSDSTTGTTQTRGDPLKVSFTRYGSGDSFGSSSCTANAGACLRKGAGYTVAISENLYGGTVSGTPGDSCGTCWKLTTDGGKSVTVVVDNLCPRQGNPLCSQQTTNDVNALGGHANFDLCSDSGAADALLGAGVGTGTGMAVKVKCDGANESEF